MGLCGDAFFKYERYSKRDIGSYNCSFCSEACTHPCQSIQLFLTSKNEDTRKSRYQLACQHYGELGKVRPYMTEEQRKIVDMAIDDFVKADDLYRHPNRVQVKKAKNDDFWETYVIFEMMEIFSGDDE